jgi:quercetin dioxygenase-like cupin family protein
MFTKAEGPGARRLLEGVDIRTLAHGERTLMAEFRIAKGAVIPEHDHPQEQTGYLVSGRLKFTVRGETVVAEPGDSWCLPAGTVHGAEGLEETVVVEVFSPVREDYLP